MPLMSFAEQASGCHAPCNGSGDVGEHTQQPARLVVNLLPCHVHEGQRQRMLLDHGRLDCRRERCRIGSHTVEEGFRKPPSPGATFAQYSIASGVEVVSSDESQR